MLVKRLYWIIPICFLLIGVGIIFWDSINEVTEPPAGGWSRGIKVGESYGNKYPLIEKDSTNSFSIYQYGDNTEFIKKSYDINSLAPKDNKSFSNIPFNKWNNFININNKLYYINKDKMFDVSGSVVVKDIDSFYTLNEQLFYQQDRQIKQFEGESTEEKTIFELENDRIKWKIISDEDKPRLLTINNEANPIMVKINSDQGETLFSQEIEISSMKKIKEAAVTSNKQKVNLLYLVAGKSHKSKNQQELFLLQIDLETMNSSIQQVTFPDPYAQTMLTDISDFTLNYQNGNITALFSALGYSETKYRDTTSFNIYEATYTNNTWDVTRRSNTSKLSSKPQRVSDQVIAWIDQSADKNTVLVSSSKNNWIEQGNKISRDDFLFASGKAFGMISFSFLTFILGIKWYLITFCLIGLLYVIRRRFIDTDPKWIYYLGIAIYAVSCYLTIDTFFTETVMNSAPSFLTFPFSNYVFTTIFGMIAYFSTYLGEKRFEWHTWMKLFYFMTIHIVLLTIYFGSYIL
ncbi:hypothetical protein [Paraliobacillus ryukyuensis]|uniref:hypothetical protein n=1 Tax=Paraliobacillus ryukyuensis TaxID=200904 RepID=UPI0009A75ABE|nr:hypothetical protein [Paraliobacillus ryukyuensis]